MKDTTVIDLISGNRKGKGKCRNAMYSSFEDEPDDQEAFTFSDEDGSETNTTARMFSMAVVDGLSFLNYLLFFNDFHYSP